jgi:RNA polymerase-binding transcription factor DksA
MGTDGLIRMEDPVDEARFRTLLEDERMRLEGLRDGLSEATQTVERETAADPGAGGHLADAGSEMFERSRDLSIVEDIEAGLVEVSHAMERIERGTYGRCEACGREIGGERLEARPAARFCLDDQREAEREAHLS